METNCIYNEDCIKVMRKMPDLSVDCILTDPPYLYLKGQRLDRPFDETAFFDESKRVLKRDGFIVLFGRGTSFYRWNTMLAERLFNFKEEVVWDKSYCTSPLMAMSRVHETISIHSKGKGAINRVKVPYLEMKGGDPQSIMQDIKRMSSILGNPRSLEKVRVFLESNIRDTSDSWAMCEKSIIRHDIDEATMRSDCSISSSSRIRDGDRSVNVMSSMTFGMNEKSIIKQVRDHYKTVHPTQKPVRLLERLLALVTKPGGVVLDPFAGSCSTAVACLNLNRRYICCEIDEEYYKAASDRIASILKEPKLAL